MCFSWSHTLTGKGFTGEILSRSLLVKTSSIIIFPCEKKLMARQAGEPRLGILYDMTGMMRMLVDTQWHNFPDFETMCGVFWLRSGIVIVWHTMEPAVQPSYDHTVEMCAHRNSLLLQYWTVNQIYFVDLMFRNAMNLKPFQQFVDEQAYLCDISKWHRNQLICREIQPANLLYWWYLDAVICL